MGVGGMDDRGGGEHVRDTRAELHNCLRQYHRLAMNVMHIEYSSRCYQLYATFGSLPN